MFPRRGQQSGASTQGDEPDLTIISDLLESKERDHYNVEARKLLAEQYAIAGWAEAAAGEMQEVLDLQPDDRDAISWLRRSAAAGASTSRQKPRTSIVRPPTKLSPPDSKPVAGGNYKVLIEQLETGFRSLMRGAEILAQDLQISQDLNPDLDLSSYIEETKALAEGRFTSSSATPRDKKPATTREVARDVMEKGNFKRRLNVMYMDLESTARSLRSQGHDGDTVRDAIRRRSDAVKSSLPEALTEVCDVSFMHLEHELLGRNYQNEDGQTMLGDDISSVPRDHFWATEDGYAWDMSELANAIKANNGVMRNPLSKQMFTAADVKAIVRHPLGRGLAAMQVRQHQLSNGLRPSTIEELDRIAKVMLEDQSDDAAESRRAVDAFMAYVATLPQQEQGALRELRVAARDSHTGAEYDASIGEAVDDARANRMCFHKTGDLLQQAAIWLRTQNAGRG